MINGNKSHLNFSSINSKLVLKTNIQSQITPNNKLDDIYGKTQTTAYETTRSFTKDNSMSFPSLSKSGSKERLERLDTERSNFSYLSLNASYSQSFNNSNEISSRKKKSKKNNFIRLEAEGRIIEELDDRKRNYTASNDSSPYNNKMYSNEIKKLDYWDMEHTRKGNLKRPTSEKDEFNRRTFVKQMTNLDIKKLKQKIEEGINILPLAKSEEDIENVIIRQNISVVKNKFNFNIFLNKPTLRKEEISDLDKYRNIMKEKIVNETFERNMLIEISNKLYGRKIDRNSISQQISNLSVKLDKYKTEYFFKCDKLNYEKKEIDKIFSELIESYKKPTNSQMTNSSINIQTRVSNYVRMGTTEDNLFKIQMEWARLIAQKEKDSQKLEKWYNDKKQDLLMKIENLKYRLQELGNEIKKLDSMLKNKMAINKEYYQIILIKGIDCRIDGLSWCVRKLIELNCYLDYNMFPKFLDHSQVDYLIQLGTLQVQASYYRSILKILKERQIRLREEDHLTYGNILNNFIQEESSKVNSNPAMSTKIFFYGDSNFNIEEHIKDDKQTFTGQVFSKKIMNTFQTIFHKYSHLMKYTFQNKLEEIASYRIVNDFKLKIKNEQIKASKKLTGEQILKNVVSKYLDEVPEKGYFEDILELRNASKEIEVQIQELINEQKKMFEIQYESTKFYNTSKTINYDLIYKALFGNGITI